MTHDIRTDDLARYAHPSPEIADDPPADLLWLRRAALLPGRWTLTTALLLLLESRGLARREFIRLGPDLLEQYRLGKAIARRSLQRLDEAGMIQVWWRHGSPPLVAIVEMASEDGPVPSDGP